MTTVTRYGETIDLSFEHKTRCPKCHKNGRDKSNDNLHVYGLDENGKHLGCHCFSCNYTIPSEEWLEENRPITIEDMEYELVGSLFNKDVHDGIKSITSFNSKGYRGITPETSKFFGVRYEFDQETGEVVNSYYPITKGILDGVSASDALVGFKVRKHPKGFHAVGDIGKECDLFMQFRFPTHNGHLVICAGEVDALSVYQMLKDNYDKRGNKTYDMTAVVCGVTGEGGVEQFKSNFEWINRFSKVIVCYDNDTAGKKCADALAQVLPRGKTFLMDLRLKDANEYLTQGRESEFITDYWNAKPYMPSGLVGSSSLSERIREHALIEKIPLPTYMHKLQKLMAGGIPLGVIVTLIGASGQGKSTHAEEIVYKWIFDSPYKVGIISLESDSGEYGTKILSRHIGKKINLIEDVSEKIEFLSQDWVIEKERELFYNEFGGDRFVLVDDRDGNVEDLKKLVETMIIKSGVKVVILDPAQDVFASLSDSEQNEFMTWQKNIVKRYSCTILNISHTKKSLTTGGAGSQGVDIVEEDAHGTSALYKSAAANLLFGRNKEAECPVERNTTHMKLSKCRWTGNTSPSAGKYYYDNTTHTVHDYDEYMLANPHMLPTEEGEF